MARRSEPERIDRALRPLDAAEALVRRALAEGRKLTEAERRDLQALHDAAKSARDGAR